MVSEDLRFLYQKNIYISAKSSFKRDCVHRRATAYVDGGYFNTIGSITHVRFIGSFWWYYLASSARTAKLFCEKKVALKALLLGLFVAVELWAITSCILEVVVSLLEAWIFKVSQCAALSLTLAVDVAFRI